MELWAGSVFAYFPSWDCLNTIGAIVVFIALGILALMDFRSQRTCTRENQHMDESSLPVISLEALKLHNGVTVRLVYCCLKGRVYDVSSSQNFSPGGSYSFLAGADATLGMAKMSHDRELVSCMKFEQLTDDEWQCVNGWVSYMDAKYKCVARLKEYEAYKENCA